MSKLLKGLKFAPVSFILSAVVTVIFFSILIKINGSLESTLADSIRLLRLEKIFKLDWPADWPSMIFNLVENILLLLMFARLIELASGCLAVFAGSEGERRLVIFSWFFWQDEIDPAVQTVRLKRQNLFQRLAGECRLVFDDGQSVCVRLSQYQDWNS